jgi:hypothetical protein
MNGQELLQFRAAVRRATAEDRGWLRPFGSRDIGVRDWPVFCEWFTAGCRGIVASLERYEKGSGRQVDCVEGSFLRLGLRRLENGITALTVIAQGESRDLPDPRRVTFQTSADGRPSRLTVAYEDGEFVAHFTGGLNLFPSQPATQGMNGRLAGPHRFEPGTHARGAEK